LTLAIIRDDPQH